MDALKAEIEKKKRKATEDVGQRPTKYMKKGDLERLEREKEAAAKAAAEQKKLDEKSMKVEKVRLHSI